MRRPEPEGGAVLRERRAQRVERHEHLARVRDLGQHVGDRGRDHAAGSDVGGEGLALVERDRQPAFEHQLPDVLDRTRLGQVDRAVLAVVVEAFEAAHVADGGVGHDDALEPLRHLVRLGIGGLDHRDAHEVAHGDDPDQLETVDHRDVPVAPLGEAREGRTGLDRRTRGVGIGGHPFRHLGRGGVRARGGEADHVALGEDPDRAVIVIDDDDGADLVFAHALRGDRHGLGGLRGDDRLTHEVADGSFYGHARHSTAVPGAFGARSTPVRRRFTCRLRGAVL